MSRKLAHGCSANVVDLQSYRTRLGVLDQSSDRSHVSIVMNPDGYIDCNSQFANPDDAGRMLDALLCLVIKARRAENGDAL